MRGACLNITLDSPRSAMAFTLKQKVSRQLHPMGTGRRLGTNHHETKCPKAGCCGHQKIHKTCSGISSPDVARGWHRAWKKHGLFSPRARWHDGSRSRSRGEGGRERGRSLTLSTAARVLASASNSSWQVLRRMRWKLMGRVSPSGAGNSGNCCREWHHISLKSMVFRSYAIMA